MAASGPASADDYFGVRNRIFEHEDLGFSFIWDEPAWGPSEATSDRVTLISQLTNTPGMLDITFSEATQTAHQLVVDLVNKMIDDHGMEVVRAPLQAYARGTTDGGNVVWDITCKQVEGLAGPRLVLFVFNAENAPFNRLGPFASETVESLKAPDPDWSPGRARETGILDVFDAVPTWDGSTVKLQIMLKNVDDYPSEFDANRLYLADSEADDAARYIQTYVRWNDGDTNPIRSIPIDGEASGTVTFEGIDEPLAKLVIYEEPDGHRRLITRVGGIVGSSGRPRIDPGR
jgi:hypothetical protein